MKNSLACVLCLAMAVACGNGPKTSDAGPHDAGPVDAGPDAGPDDDAGNPPAVCSNSNTSVPQGCISCLQDLFDTEPCIEQFTSQCEGDSACLSYDNCLVDCNQDDAGTSGSDQGCLAQSMDGGVLDSSACGGCCADTFQAGVNDYVSDIVNDCVCAPGAPCADACQ